MREIKFCVLCGTRIKESNGVCPSREVFDTGPHPQVPLNDVMEFDTPVRVSPDRVERVADLWAPEVINDPDHDMVIDGLPYREHPEWEALVGYTGQYSYNGPVMHPSEFIGGGLERDILDEPGTYVVVEVRDDDTERDDLIGWAVLRRREVGA